MKAVSVPSPEISFHYQLIISDDQYTVDVLGIFVKAFQPGKNACRINTLG
jgi:hypothetical protein